MSKASELRLAKRMARLGTGRDIVHLEVGEPDFDTPGNIIEAATDAPPARCTIIRR
jgi:aspartate/methionine/tyrosine aminotransferase